jgi:hypothetical protein
MCCGLAPEEVRSVATVIKEVEIVDLSPNEAFSRFDQACQQYLGLSGRDFVANYRKGCYDDTDVDSMPGLSKVLSFLPFAGL